MVANDANQIFVQGSEFVALDVFLKAHYTVIIKVVGDLVVKARKCLQRHFDGEGTR